MLIIGLLDLLAGLFYYRGSMLVDAPDSYGRIGAMIAVFLMLSSATLLISLALSNLL
jgi:hypothetical protein